MEFKLTLQQWFTKLIRIAHSSLRVDELSILIILPLGGVYFMHTFILNSESNWVGFGTSVNVVCCVVNFPISGFYCRCITTMARFAWALIKESAIL